MRKLRPYMFALGFAILGAVAASFLYFMAFDRNLSLWVSALIGFGIANIVLGGEVG